MFLNSKGFVLVCMIDYKEYLSIRLDVVLSDILWIFLVLIFNVFVKIFLMYKGK